MRINNLFRHFEANIFYNDNTGVWFAYALWIGEDFSIFAQWQTTS